MSNDPTGDSPYGPRPPPPKYDAPQGGENPYAAGGQDASGADHSKPVGYVRLKPHRANAVLALGLGGVLTALVGGLIALTLYFCCPLFLIPLSSVALSIPAWIMGQNDLAAMKNGEMDPSGRDMTMIGMVCGIVGLSIVALGVLIIIFLVVLYAVVIGIAVTNEAGA